MVREGEHPYRRVGMGEGAYGWENWKREYLKCTFKISNFKKRKKKLSWIICKTSVNWGSIIQLQTRESCKRKSRRKKKNQNEILSLLVNNSILIPLSTVQTKDQCILTSLDFFYLTFVCDTGCNNDPTMTLPLENSQKQHISKLIWKHSNTMLAIKPD